MLNARSLALAAGLCVLASPASGNDFINNGFETPAAGSSPYYLDMVTQTNTGWGASGWAYFQRNGSWMSASANAPEGVQTAALQCYGSSYGRIWQSVTFPAAGWYTVRFKAAQHNTTYQQAVGVFVDGAWVQNGAGATAIVYPYGRQFSAYASTPFYVSAGIHTVGLAALSDQGANGTILIDDVHITRHAPSGDQALGFESITPPTDFGFGYHLSTAYPSLGWVLLGYGIVWMDPSQGVSLEGTKAALLGNCSNCTWLGAGAMEQVFLLNPGSHTLSFWAVQADVARPQTIKVSHMREDLTTWTDPAGCTAITPSGGAWTKYQCTFSTSDATGKNYRVRLMTTHSSDPAIRWVYVDNVGLTGSCGDSVKDSYEQCDSGSGFNENTLSCCTADCQTRPATVFGDVAPGSLYEDSVRTLGCLGYTSGCAASNSLKLVATTDTQTSGNKYALWVFSTASIVVQAGDVVEYDVFLPTNTTGTGGIDIRNTDGTRFQESGWVDQNGLMGHPTADLRARAYNTWYHRTLTVPASMAGKTIKEWHVAAEADGVSVTSVALYRNVRLLRGGTPVVVAYAGTMTANSLAYQNAYATVGVNSEPQIDFCPANPVTLAQAAFFLMRAKYGGDNFDYPASPVYFPVDVPKTHIWFKYVQKMYQLGVYSGCAGTPGQANGTFCGGNALTRELAAVFLQRAAVLPACSHGSTAHFPVDVKYSPKHAYYDQIQALADKVGVADTQCAASTFCPTTNVTRLTLAKWLDKSFGLKGCGNGRTTGESGEVCEITQGPCCKRDCTGYESSAKACRPAVSDCDVAEYCSGSSATCGNDGFKSAGTLCRASAGTCDVAETCSGQSAFCPEDGFQSGAVMCRSAGSNPVCAPATYCSGYESYCPQATYPYGLLCDDGNPATGPDTCNGAGTCSPGPTVVTTAQRIPLYGAFADSTHDAFYTVVQADYQWARNNGYNVDLGVPMYVESAQISGTTPLYHLYSSARTEHLYTNSWDEVLALSCGTTPCNPPQPGKEFIRDGNDGYIYTSHVAGTVPLRRLYKYYGGSDYAHRLLAQTDDSVVQQLVSAGWVLDQSVMGYVWPGDNGTISNGGTCTTPADCTGGSCVRGKCQTGGNYILYLHGRQMRYTPGEGLLSHQPGWRHITFTYNGSAHLDHPETRNVIKQAMLDYCSGGNTCVAVCFSAGCNRMLMGFHDAGGANALPGFLEGIAIASAAGGTELVDPKLRSMVKLIGVIFAVIAIASAIYTISAFVTSGLEFAGGFGAMIQSYQSGMNIPISLMPLGTAEDETDIDSDLMPHTMRDSDHFGYIQNTAPGPIYHLAGHKNICHKLKLLFIPVGKICGNRWLKGDRGDGVVPMHSSCGFATDVTTGSMDCHYTGAAKYTLRTSEGYDKSYDADHGGMYGVGFQLGSARLAGVWSHSIGNIREVDQTLPDCHPLYDDCQIGGRDPNEPVESIVGKIMALDSTNAAKVIYNTTTLGFCADCDMWGISACRYFSGGLKKLPDGTIIQMGYDPGPMTSIWHCERCQDITGTLKRCCDLGGVLYGFQHTQTCEWRTSGNYYGPVYYTNLRQWNLGNKMDWVPCCWPPPGDSSVVCGSPSLADPWLQIEGNWPWPRTCFAPQP